MVFVLSIVGVVMVPRPFGFVGKYLNPTLHSIYATFQMITHLSLLRLLSLVLLIIFCTKMKQFPHPYLDFTAHSENPACQSSWLSCILPLGGKQSQVLRRHGTSQQQRRVSSSRLSRVPTGRKIHDPVSHFRYHHVCMAYALAFCSSRRFRATDF